MNGTLVTMKGYSKDRGEWVLYPPDMYDGTYSRGFVDRLGLIPAGKEKPLIREKEGNDETFWWK